jgi:hypothetical protein
MIAISSCSTLHRSAIRSNINELYNSKVEQNNFINRLISKNDSLSEGGIIYDSVSKEEAIHLNDLRLKTDDELKEVTYLKHTVDFNVGYKEQFPVIKYRVSNLHNQWVASSNKKNEELKSIDKRLDDSNMGGEKKVLKGMLNSAAAQQEKEAQAVTALGDTKKDLLATGNLPTTTGDKLDERFKLYARRADSINAEIKRLGQQLESPASFSKDFTIIKTKIILIDSVVNKNAGAREYILNMIHESLLKSSPNIFNLAAFFGPGGYIIPADKYAIARQYFSPVLDSLIKFSNAYASLPRTATIIVNGYADASQISKGSKLYEVISKYLNKTSPSKAELNTGLSALRSEEISMLLTKMVKERATEFLTVDKVVFLFSENGEGEKVPNPKITDYKKNDERRRVVIIFWNALPND